ncbi:hypothetical protein [Paenibacillus alkalitolerans]|nr:hypothetical protein [Paenibacillus alkalitolerans]
MEIEKKPANEQEAKDETIQDNETNTDYELMQEYANQLNGDLDAPD